MTRRGAREDPDWVPDMDGEDYADDEVRLMK